MDLLGKGMFKDCVNKFFAKRDRIVVAFHIVSIPINVRKIYISCQPLGFESVIELIIEQSSSR